MATTARSFRVKLETVFRWQSLRTRLTIFILTIFLLSIWSLALYASRMLHGDMERMLGEQQFSTVSIVAARVNQELSDRLRAVEKIASGITPAMLKDPAFVQRYLKHCMVIEVFFSGGLFVTPTDGRVIADVASPRGPRIGINYSDREWMGEVLKGKAVISEPVVGKMSRKPGFAIAAPVFGGSGEVVGAVVGVVDLEWPSFLDEITGRRFGKSGSYFVIAPRQKVVVTSTNRNLVMRPLSPLSMNPLTKRYLQGYEGSGIAVDPWGVEVLVSAKRIPAAGWIVIARIPTNEVFAPIHAMQMRVLIAAILLSLLVGGLAWWWLRRCLAPVFDTIETLAAWSDGDTVPQPLPITRRDEIGALIDGFNRLLTTLARRETELKESEALFRNLFKQHAAVKLLIDSLSGRIVDANDRAVEYYGWSREELLQMRIQDINTLSFEEIVQEMEKVRACKRTHFDFRHRLADGSIRDVEVFSSRIETRGAELLHSIIHDVTERKRLEEERERLLAELQRSFSELKTLGGLLPICSSCKKIRNDNGYWEQLEVYIRDHSDAEFSHGICPECVKELYPNLTVKQ